MVGNNWCTLDGQKVRSLEYNKQVLFIYSILILFITCFFVFHISNLLDSGVWKELVKTLTVDNAGSSTIYYEVLLGVKRKQYLVYKFLRDVVKEPIAPDSKMKEIGKLIQSLQERLYKIQDMLPYADYFQGKGQIKSYPEEIQAKAFMVLGQIKGEPWHVLAMEHGVYVRGLAVRVGDW